MMGIPIVFIPVLVFEAGLGMTETHSIISRDKFLLILAARTVQVNGQLDLEKPFIN